MIIDWLPEAIRNRFDQLDYIAEDNPLAAADQDDEIERQVNMLHDHPKMGRPGVLSQNRRNFRHPSSSPATSASRSIILPSLWKV